MIWPVLLLACLPLAGNRDRITAADLAPAEPAFAALPPETELGFAPAAGGRRIFTAAELARLARRHGLALESKSEVCLEWPLEPLDPRQLAAAMAPALDLPDAKIEILEFSRYPAPRGAIELPRAGLTSGLWKGFVRYGESRRFPIWARVRISVRSRCVVAREELPAGRPIGRAQVEVKEHDGFPAREPAATSVEEVIGRLPRRAIRAGAMVPINALDAPCAITRGQTVEVEVKSGEAQITLQGRAQADGRTGQTIPILNPSSGRTFRARVEGPGKAVAGVE